ncbi:MAG TPA: hypothetical protein EYQ47_03925 [Cycloclasticus sp.]|jgi:beta-lactamase superfamily II metal-dependent hydrolase|nr:hypothetical protein [Cycloclasticus sp.]
MLLFCAGVLSVQFLDALPEFNYLMVAVLLSLLQYKAEQLKADVIVSPHHGSKTFSSERFIAALDPDYVLLPVGYRNRFGFPKEQIVSRYSKRDVAGFNAANHGALSFDKSTD